MKKRKKRWSLERRLILSVMLVFCVPMILIGSYALVTLNQKLYDNALASANAMLDAVEQEFVTTLTGIENTASVLTADTKLYSFLSRPQSEVEVVHFYSETIRPMGTQIQLQSAAFRSLRILHRNQTLFNIPGMLVRLSDMRQITDLMKEGQTMSVRALRYADQGRPWGAAAETRVWYIDCAVPPAYYTSPVGVVELVLDHDTLWQKATQVVQGTGLRIALVQEGRVISATDASCLEYATEYTQVGVSRRGGNTLVVRENSVMHMNLCCTIPAAITSLATSQLLLVALLLLAIVAVTWMMVRLTCQRQLRSLNALTARIDAISPNGAAVAQQEPEDEVERLSLHFDSMYKRLGDAFAREKRLLYDDLTNQLKPHFICNAMDMLRLQAQHYNQDQLAESVLQINQYFRYAMLDSGGSATLGEETDNAINYMKLVNVMRENKICFDLSLDAWTESHLNTAMIPKMLFQPLLENAVRHGVQMKKNAYICLHMMHDGGELEIRVEDNGGGIDAEVQDKLNAMLSGRGEMENGRHVGLINVIRRLKLLYPNAYTACIQSSQYGGTTVTLRLRLDGRVS